MKTLIHFKQSKTFIIYREDTLRLLAYPKPIHDQLCLELPCLMGFRAKEVCTWRAEYIDFEHGNTLVMDAKKKQLFLVPLNFQVANHAKKILNGRKEGYVLRSRSTRNKGEQISPFAVWHVWRKWSIKANLLNYEEFSPVVGRRFFACTWYYWLRLSLIGLSLIMRHSEPRVTLGYVQKLVFYEDLKREYKQFQLSFLQKDAEPNIQELKQMIEKVFASLEQRMEIRHKKIKAIA